MSGTARAYGTVYLVGAGPGAPDLLTLRAARLLAEADIVFHDALVPPAVLRIAAQALQIAVGKRCGRRGTAQRSINERLLAAATTHRVVVRLKGGDPMLFGRAQEELDFLEQNGVPVELVPGVTAALASSAALRVSLTRRGLSRSVAFVTPRVAPGERPGDWAGGILGCDTGVIYMGAGEARAVAEELTARGLPRDTPVAVVRNASLPDERCDLGTLALLAELCARADGPAIIIVGEVLERKACAADSEGELRHDVCQLEPAAA